MAIRKSIEFSVSKTGISPSTYQNIGIQSDHNVSEVVFNLDQDLYHSLTENAIGDILYRFDSYTASGEMKSSEYYHLSFENTPLIYSVSEWLTHSGGDVKVVLVITDISNGKTHFEFNAPPALLRFSYKPESVGEASDSVESLTTLARNAEIAANLAENAAEVSKEAEANTKAAEKVLTEGTFVFLGGDANGGAKVNLVVDSQLSEYSSNPVANAAVAKKFKEYTNTLDLNNLIKKAVDAAVLTAKLAAHPIGSYYWSENSTDPANLFGGTWVQVKDKFILAAGDIHAVGEAGGKETVKLEEKHMPSHNHNIGYEGSYGFSKLKFGYGQDLNTHSAIIQGNATTSWKEIEVSNTGNNEAHNNMPPYITAYCWKRIA